MRTMLSVLLRDSHQILAMRFDQADQANAAADQLVAASNDVDLLKLGPDADGSTSWIDPSRVQAILVSPDLSGGAISVPRPVPRR